MLFLLAAVLLSAAPLAAQSADTDTVATLDFPSRLVAGVSPAPPFAIKNPDGTWDGVAVELWRRIGRQAGFETELREIPMEDLLDAVANGTVDVALTLRASAEGEQRVDFTAPHYTASIGVAKTKGGIGAVLGRFFSPTFFKIAAGLSVLLLIVGFIIWRFERRENEDDFREGKEGLWDGFWWAGVTMTTIGYGDKSPDSVSGKITALLWMLIAMGVTASLTAALVSSLGLGGGSGGGSVKIPGDLRDKAVGVVEESAAAGYLEEEGVSFETFADVTSGLKAVESDNLDMFVGPAPVLGYYNEEGSFDLKVGTTQAEPQVWAFAVADGADLREPLSRAVLTETRGAAWRALLSRYSSVGS